MEAFTISMLAFRYGVADVLDGSIISRSLSKRRRKPRKKQPGNNLLKDQKGPVMRPFVYIFRSDLFAISFKSFDRAPAPRALTAAAPASTIAPLVLALLG